MDHSPVAAVSGSNGGIGAEVVRTLQRAGYRVVSNGRSAGKGPGDVHVRADVSTAAGAKRVIAAARKLGGLDLLVCGVGDFVETPVSALNLDAWQAVFESNLTTAWRCCREALPLLRKRGGAIVTFGGTVTNATRSNPRYVAYQMAKSALTVFTKSLAQAEAPNGVRVNMVNPGIIGRDRRSKSVRIPAGRAGEPKDIAEAVAWLASDAARYVNGAVLDVGGALWV